MTPSVIPSELGLGRFHRSEARGLIAHVWSEYGTVPFLSWSNLMLSPLSVLRWRWGCRRSGGEACVGFVFTQPFLMLCCIFFLQPRVGLGLGSGLGLGLHCCGPSACSLKVGVRVRVRVCSSQPISLFIITRNSSKSTYITN